MKILFVLEHYHPYVGGAEQLFKTVAEGLADNGAKVRVLTTLFDSKLPKKEIVNGVEICRVNCFNRFLFTLLSIPAAVKYAGKTDLIFTTSYTAAFPAWVAGFLRRKKRIIVFHEVWGQLWHKLPYLSFIQRQSFYLFEKFILGLSFHQFIAVSDFTKECLAEAGIPEEKITRIYNGLEYDDFESYTQQLPDVFTVTYLGRLGVSKGLDLLIPAAAAFAEKYPESRFKIILPRRPEDFLKKIFSEMDRVGLKAPNLVILHELSRHELFEEMLSSSCIVVPSYSEGFGFVAAETVALKLPIISSQKGALSEVVGGKTVAMKKQTTSGLFEALEAAYRKEWQNLEIKEFPFQKTIDAYLELIRKMG